MARLQLVSKHKNKDLVIKRLYDVVEKRKEKKKLPTNKNPTMLFQVMYRRHTWQLFQLVLICAPHSKKNIGRLKKDLQAL